MFSSDVESTSVSASGTTTSARDALATVNQTEPFTTTQSFVTAFVVRLSTFHDNQFLLTEVQEALGAVDGLTGVGVRANTLTRHCHHPPD